MFKAGDIILDKWSTNYANIDVGIIVEVDEYYYHIMWMLYSPNNVIPFTRSLVDMCGKLLFNIAELKERL